MKFWLYVLLGAARIIVSAIVLVIVAVPDKCLSLLRPTKRRRAVRARLSISQAWVTNVDN